MKISILEISSFFLVGFIGIFLFEKATIK